MSEDRQRRGFFAILMPTLECNMSCSYCFVRHEAGRWSDGQTDHVLHEVFALARREHVDHLRIHWQGGEPLLMGVDYWARTLERAGALAAASGIETEQVMQTNLTLYEPALAPLVREHLGGRLGTSFEEHDRTIGEDRDYVREWKASLDAARSDGIEVGVLTLLRPWMLGEDGGKYLDGLSRRYALSGVRITLPFATSNGRGGFLDPAQAGRFLVEAYSFWEDGGGDDRLRVKPFAFLRSLLTGTDPREHGLCFFALNCASVGLAVTPEGNVTLCDNFATDPAWEPFGNLFESTLATVYDGTVRARIRAAVSDLICSECLECDHLALCNGGCLARSVPGPGGRPRFHYCVTYRMLFDEIRRRASRRGRSGAGGS